MLMPKKVKHRKQHRGRMTGKAWRGSTVSFGDYGLRAMEPCWLTDRQIEAARVAMTRFIKRGGKIWIRVFPDKPITKKPQETRMGKGKGAPEGWVAVGESCSKWKGLRRRLRNTRCNLQQRSCRFTRSSRLDSVKRRRHDQDHGASRAWCGGPRTARERARRAAFPSPVAAFDGAAGGGG